MSTKYTPRERVMRVLRGEPVDKVPFTSYECFARPCTAERVLRERGMCVVWRTSSYKITRPGVDIRTIHYTDPASGEPRVRTEYHTPEGLLTSLSRPAPNTTWALEYPFKSPDDYKALKALFRSARVEPAYEAAAALERDLGEDYLVRDGLPLEPLQGLISGPYFDPAVFGIEWMDHRDEILELYEISARLNEQCYELVANGPLQFSNYGGNVVPQIIGQKVFREMYMPHYAAAADALHAKGKLIGSHFDADNTPVMADLAATKLDYIEAYDPMCSPDVGEAFAAFGDKVLWINWPSAAHLLPMEGAREKTRDMVRQAKAANGRFIIGITEDVPPDRWQAVFAAIMDGTEEVES